MLPQQNRIKKKKDFEEIFNKGKTFKQDFLLLTAMKNNNNVSRFGFVVSKKVSKKACIRNRIKRVLREIARKEIGLCKTGLDIVVVARPGIETINFQSMEELLIALLKKSKTLK